MEIKFYKCAKCGKIIAMFNDKPCPTMCCGEAMMELIPGAVDAAKEKHIPQYVREDGKVKVTIGEVAHPMTEEHFIQYVVLKSKKGYQIKELHPGDEPKCGFHICDCDEVIEVLAYCNLHGLWKK